MTQGEANPKVDAFLANVKSWRDEFVLLREIARSCDLVEDLKWGQPCYTLGGKNVVLMHGFKEYCALLFFHGALMKDEGGLLVQPTENVQAGRQIRFTSLEEVARMKNVLKAYIEDAIAVEKSGQKVVFKKTTEFAVPEEFKLRLDGDVDLKAAFERLTPGRQRAYLLYFSSAKQAKTREQRIDKYTAAILDGKGLDD